MSTAVLSMQVPVEGSDPVRGLTMASVNGHAFLIRTGAVNIEVLDQDQRPLGSLLATMYGGALWQGAECVGRYAFDKAQGYSVRPVVAGIAHGEVVKQHPLDFLLRLLAH